MGSACFPSTASSRFGPLSCSRGFVSARPFAGMGGVADSVLPLKDGNGERGGAKVCLADVDRRRQQLCHRIGQGTSHGSIDRPGGVEGSPVRPARLCEYRTTHKLFGGELMNQEPTSVLIVAHQTAATPALLEAVRERAHRGPSKFHLLVPRRRRSGDRTADPQEVGVHEAREVLHDTLPQLSEAAGSEVGGDIGETDALKAIEDALGRAHYDEIIVSTLRLGVSRWLKNDLVSKAQAFGLPVHHVVGKDSRVAGAANR
jgi:hypothetical protein